jgi:hypothetical protein
MTMSSLVKPSRILQVLGFFLMIVGLVLSTTAGGYTIIVNRVLRHTIGVTLVTIQVAISGVAFIAIGLLLIFKIGYDTRRNLRWRYPDRSSLYQPKPVGTSLRQRSMWQT